MKIIRAIIDFLRSSKARKGRQRALAALMAVVVFCTTYTLILPAITLDNQTAETEPGIEVEKSAEETLSDVQEADLLLKGQNADDADAADAGDSDSLVVESADEPAETKATVSSYENEVADTEQAATSDDAADVTAEESAQDTEEETQEVYASSPLTYHCDEYDIELSFDSDDWQLPEGTQLSVKELRKDAEEDSEEYRDYHYYDDRAKEELSDRDEELADRAYALHYYELELKADGEELSMPEGKADVTIKYNPEDKSEYNAKEFGDEETVLASLFWLSDWHTNLFDENDDESKIYTITDHQLKKIQIKDVELSDFDNVIGLFACPPEKKVTLKAEGSDYSVTAVCSQKSKVPEDAKLTVSEIKPGSKEFDQYLNSAREALGEEKENNVPAEHARFFDIKIMVDGEEFTPEAEIDVKINFHEPIVVEQMQDVNAVHFGEEGTEVLDAKTEEGKDGIENVSFTADSFSVYGVVYTVDFHWEVDGKEYEFSLPGGGFVTLQQLVEVLGIIGDIDFGENQDGTGAEIAEKFVADVVSVKFSSPELVDVSKVEVDTTVGQIKENRGLECEYSAEMTEEQISDINAQTVEAGDWALISMKPFTTEETLAVKMNNGEVFSIKVTDNQASDPLGLDGESFIITNNAHNRALQMSTYSLNVSAQPPSSDANDIWKFEYDKDAFNEQGGYYLVCTVNDVEYYLNADNGQFSVTTTKFLPEGEEPGSGTKTASPFKVAYDTNTLRYRISASSDGNSAFLGISNNGITLDNSKQDRNLVSLRSPDSGGNTPGTIGTWDIKSDGIALKLFDYSGYMAQLRWGHWEQTNNEIDGQWAPRDLNQLREGDGINYHRSLLFSGSGISGSRETFNNFTGSRPDNTGYYSGYAMQDIVNYNLGDNRFPVLRPENVQDGTLDKNEGGSLAYLFDDKNITMTSHSGQYAKRVYNGADGNGLDGLLRKDDEGYYFYDSEQNYARLIDNEVILYSDTYKKKDGDSSDVKTRKIGLFPFTDYDSSKTEEKSPNSNYYNHQFGMTIATDFVYPTNGIVPETDKPMTFEFSGDDDVWVFVDGVLVLDLGGVHQPISGKIDFNSGDVTITEFGSNGVEYMSSKSTTIDDMFEKASQEAGKQITFDRSEYSSHKLEFFYLERGGCDSNCKIKFNLLTTKSVTLEKKLEGLSEEELAKYSNQSFTFEFCKKNSNRDEGFELYNTEDAENTDAEKNHTVRRNAAGEVIDTGFPIKNGQISLRPGESVTVSMLPSTAEFHVAEIDQANMAAYDRPSGERYYNGEKLENITLEPSRSHNIETVNDWQSDDYAVSDTDKTIIINEPLHTNLTVNKVWGDGYENHPEGTIKFTVQATIPGEEEGAAPVPYEVSDIKDKEFEVTAESGWMRTIENLPEKTPDGKPITYTVTEIPVEGYTSTVTAQGSVHTIVNTPFGKLKVKKTVTYNNKEPNAEQLKTLKGTYEFQIYKNSECTELYSNDKLTVTINENAVSESNVISLPEGTYWVKEVSGVEGILPNVNPVEVTVSAGGTTTEPVIAIANFTNNKNVNDFEDKIAIELEKQFKGLVSTADIPAGFKVTLSYKVGTRTESVPLSNYDQGNVGTDNVSIDWSESDDHMTWHWRVTQIPTEAGNFTIKEDNYLSNDYIGPTVTLNGEVITNPSTERTQTVLKPKIEFEQVDEKEINPDNDLTFLFDSDMIWLVRATANEGVIVSSVHTLSYSTRQAVIDYIKTHNFPQAQWANLPIHFYSMEEHPNGYTVHGSEIKIQKLDTPITIKDKTYHYQLVEDTFQSNHNYYYRLVFDSQSSENSFIYVNTYQQKTVDFEVIKVDKGNHEKKLPNAEFTLRKINVERPFDYIEDESKAIIRTTNEEGKATFEGLTTGYYEVKETKLPDGYVNKGDEAFYIRVDAGEVKFVVKNNGSWSEVASSGNGKFVFKTATEDNSANVTVENEPGAALPNTGGPGTTPITILGTILILLSGVLLWRRRRLI